VSQRQLDQERVTIGRKPGNDLVLPHPTVSGEHAVVITVRNDSFLEDLDSTNGTWVNGKLVKKCLLQDGDEIRIAGQVLRFVFEALPERGSGPETDELMRQIRLAQQRMADLGTATPVESRTRFSSTMLLASQSTRAGGGGGTVPAAGLRILSGPSAGKTVDLVRTTTSLGKPGIQVAVITRGPSGYDLMHQEGAEHPLLNGVPLGDEHEALTDHDIIEVAGTKLEFFLKPA
jgi:pSer/pThr/pTyr-binding forkhead associated (FHA) protein